MIVAIALVAAAAAGDRKYSPPDQKLRRALLLQLRRAATLWRRAQMRSKLKDALGFYQVVAAVLTTYTTYY